jgi:hypothetical protein
MRAMIWGALCLLAVAPARAGVVVQPGVPFTAAALEAAIAARGGPGGGEVEVEVSRPSPGRLALVTPGGTWEIEIGEASGETAARVVALHVIELGPAMPAGYAAPAAVAEAPAAEVRASAPPRAGHRYRLAALGVGARGVRAGDFTSVGGAIELTRAGRWIAGCGIGWQHGLTIDREPGAPIGASLIRARGVGGVALGPVELVAGAFAGRLAVDTGVDGRTRVIERWVTGLAAEGRVAARVSAAWSIVLAAGAELFRDRIEVRFGDTRIGATPRAALGGGIGLAWAGGQDR